MCKIQGKHKRVLHKSIKLIGEFKSMIVPRPLERLVIEVGHEDKKTVHKGGYLRRIYSSVEIPEGWKGVDTLHGRSVYQDDGRLRFCFMAVKRLDVEQPTFRSIDCHVGSQYKEALVLYERPLPNSRVFCCVIPDNDLRWKLYFGEVHINILSENSCILLFRGSNLGKYSCFEVDKNHVVRDVVELRA